MSISCLLKLKDEGQISEQAYKEIMDELNGNVPIDNINKRLNTAKQVNENNYKGTANETAIQAKNREYITNAEDPFQAISELITKSRGGTKATPMNIAMKTKEILGRANVHLAPHYKKLMSRIGGWVEPKKMHNDISSKINNPNIKASKEVEDIVKDMDKTLEYINDQLVAVGIQPRVTNLNQLAGLNTRVQNMSFKQFKKTVGPLVTDDDDVLLRAWNNAREGEEVFSFNFKDEASSQKYTETIGGDHYSNLSAYVEKQASRVSATQILGKNPEVRLEQLIKDSPKKLTLTDEKQLKYMLKEEMGTAEQVQDPNWLAKFISNVRGFGTGMLMGGSPLTMPMDIPNIIMTLERAGIADESLKTFSRTVKLLAKEDNRIALAQLGLQLESVMTALSMTSRFNPHASASNLMNKFATSTIRLGGMAVASDAMKLSTKMTFLYSLRDFKGSTFAGLRKVNPKFHQKLNQYGINETDWNVIRKSMTDEDLLFEPLKVHDDIGSKVFRMINEEGDFAVITPGSRSSYMTSQGHARGTVTGEAFKSVSQFKSTLVEQIYTQWYRMIQQDGMKNKVQFGASMFALTAVFGSMVTELKEVGKGRTLLDPTANEAAARKFIGKTIEYQSFVPFVSDAIAAWIDPRYGQPSVFTAPLNPASYGYPAQTVEKVEKLIMASTQAETEKAYNDIWRHISRLMPNFWFGVAAYNEYFVHGISSTIAPNAERNRVNKEKSRNKKTKQEKIFDMF